MIYMFHSLFCCLFQVKRILLFSHFLKYMGAAGADMRMSGIASHIGGPFPAAFAFFQIAYGYGALHSAFFIGRCAFRCFFGAFFNLCLGYEAEVGQFFFHVLQNLEFIAVGVDGDFGIQRMADGLGLSGFFQGFG